MGHSPVMGLGLSRNRSGGPFSFRLSGNTWLFWVVCSCKMRKGKVGSAFQGGKGVTEMDESRGSGPRGRSRQGEENSCPAGPYHLPPLGCSGPVSHSPIRPQRSPPARSCTPGRCPADTSRSPTRTYPLYLHQNTAAPTLTSGLGTPGFCCQNLLPGHHVRDCTDTGDLAA